MLRQAFCLLLFLTSLQAQIDPPRFTDPDRQSRILALAPELDALYRAHAASNHIPGFIYGIVVDGQLVHSLAHGTAHIRKQLPVRADTRFRIASMTKSFTALAILKLRDARRLSLSDPVSRYLPRFRKTPAHTHDSPVVTIAHLLRMAGGFPQDDPWGDRRLADSVRELEALLDEGLTHSNPPGVTWEYSNLGYTLLGHIITRVSRRPYQEYITREILHPLGMHQTVWEYSSVPADSLALGYRWENNQWQAEPLLHDGTFGAMGGLITTLDDFHRYVAFHLDAWPPRNDPDPFPVSRATRREMHRPAEFIGVALDTTDDDSPPVARANGYSCGLSWQTDSRHVTRLRHAGGLPGYGSEYRFLPAHGIGLIAFANRTYAPMTAINTRAMEFLLDRAQLPTRVLPPSAILQKRAAQLARILADWPEAELADALAPNFFLDRSREEWRKLAGNQLAGIGTVTGTSAVRPENNLRGRFDITGSEGNLSVFFTLTPEATPRIQEVRLGP